MPTTHHRTMATAMYDELLAHETTSWRDERNRRHHLTFDEDGVIVQATRTGNRVVTISHFGHTIRPDDGSPAAEAEREEAIDWLARLIEIID